MELRKHVGKSLDDFRVIEGGCYHAGYYYMIFGNMRRKLSKIVKFKSGKQKKIVKISKTMSIGHANDCCVKGGILYVTHSGKSNAVHRIDATSLVKMSDVVVSGCEGGFNAICTHKDGFLIKKMHSKKIFVLDAEFKKKDTIKLSKTRKVGQGMTCHKDRIYRASSVGRSRKNYVSVYSIKGKLLKTHHYDKVCEIEDVMIVGGKIKVSLYKKYKKGKKKHFEAYIKTIVKL